MQLAATIVGLAVLLRIPTFTRRLFDPDEAAIGVQGMVVRAGGTLYRDIFDRKPPLPALSYAASFDLTGSTDVRPLRVLVTLALAAAALLVAADAHRRWGRTAAWCGGIVFVLAVMSLYPADAGAANYAHFALLPGTAAMLWSRRGTLAWAGAAGAALGVTILCRQSWLLAIVPAAFAVWRSGRWRHAAVLLVSAAAVIATTALYAPFGSYWEWNVTNSPGFVFAPAGLGASLGRAVLSTIGFAALHLTVVVAAGVAMRRRPPWRRGAANRGSRDDLDLWLWVLTGLGAVAAGFRFFGHYWLQVVPPLVVLAIPVLAEIAARTAASRWRKPAIFGLAAPALIAFSLLFVPGSFRDRPDPRRAAAEVDRLAAPGERVFVWGSYPELLLEADRLPAGKLVHTDFVTGRSGGRNDPAATLSAAAPGAYQLMIDDLLAHPPAVVVDTSSSTQLGYEHYPLSLFPELAAFVTDRYEQVTVIDGLTIYRLRP